MSEYKDKIKLLFRSKISKIVVIVLLMFIISFVFIQVNGLIDKNKFDDRSKQLTELKHELEAVSNNGVRWEYLEYCNFNSANEINMPFSRSQYDCYNFLYTVNKITTVQQKNILSERFDPIISQYKLDDDCHVHTLYIPVSQDYFSMEYYPSADRNVNFIEGIPTEMLVAYYCNSGSAESYYKNNDSAAISWHQVKLYNGSSVDQPSKPAK